jgi:hypothetical protein
MSDSSSAIQIASSFADTWNQFRDSERAETSDGAGREPVGIASKPPTQV